MRQLTWPRAAAWRARRHHLDPRAPAGKMLAVTSRICGLHAQVLSAAELAVWARVEGLKRGAVPRALWEERKLVKTWAMRGTLHLLPSREYPLWRDALSASRRYRRPAVWQRLLGITLEELDQLTEAIGSALEGKVLTREELIREVGRHTGSPAMAGKLALNSWGTFLKPAAFTGRLCFAPSVGQLACFTRPDTWLPESRAEAAPSDPQAVAAAITRRYLSAYGPAAYHDFSRWWGGAGMTDIRKWIASLGEEATSISLEGEQVWMMTEHARELRDMPPAKSACLLPAFDPYVIGASRHAHHLLPAGMRARVYRPQGWVSPVLLVNGSMAGVWRHELKGSRVEVAIEPFRAQPAWVRRAAAVEAERLAAFFGGTLHLTWKE